VRREMHGWAVGVPLKVRKYDHSGASRTLCRRAGCKPTAHVAGAFPVGRVLVAIEAHVLWQDKSERAHMLAALGPRAGTCMT
jgi:hypothetical protein